MQNEFGSMRTLFIPRDEDMEGGAVTVKANMLKMIGEIDWMMHSKPRKDVCTSSFVKKKG